VKRRKGFTLVEIIVTLSIVCFIVALALPSYREYTSAWTCRSAAQILYVDLLAQRQRAFSLCLPTGISIGTGGTYSLWEIYNTGAGLPETLQIGDIVFPETPGTGDGVSRDPVPSFLRIMLSLIPAGCNELRLPVRSPIGSRVTKTVALSSTFPVPVEIAPPYSFVYFVPKRSAEAGKWQYCIVWANNLTVSCGADTCVINITSKGDVIMN
jgi:prepilin-type N-terminal cleavage/methylation domain-containing protein